MDKVNLRNKRILVTGGNGYLGRKLINLLDSYKANVFCIDVQDNCSTSGIDYFQVDLRKEEELKVAIHSIKPTIIYHLAASLSRTRDFEISGEIFDINLYGTLNLLKALIDINYENLIFSSTSEVYGGNQIQSPFKEDCNFVPASPYSLSKYMAEMTIRTFSEINHKNFTILRLFNFYGQDMPQSFFIPQLINKLKKNENFDMTSGEQKRDFIYISDVLHALILAKKPNAYKQVFNVCSGKGNTLKEIAMKLKELMNSKSQINFGALPYRNNEVWEMIGDNTKMKGVFDFNPQFKLNDLLK